MAEELKDLGGLVNKDLAFSKIQPNVVYDSKNFRVTTDDGATLAVRSNIKGNTFTLEIPDVPCKKTIKFDLAKITKGLFTLQDYSMEFYIEVVDTSTFFSFTYSSVEQLLQDFVDFAQTDSVFLDAGIVVVGGTYTIVNERDNYFGYVSLEQPVCGSIIIGSVQSTGSVDTTNLGYTPIDENFQNTLPFLQTYKEFNHAVNPYIFSGSFTANTLVPINYSSDYTGLTDHINQWQIENKFCNNVTSSATLHTDRYMYVNMSTGVYDSGYTLIPGSSTTTTLLYKESWTSTTVFNTHLNTGIISYTVLGEGLYTNIQDYTETIWDYDFSYATGNIENSQYEITLKVYLYMGDSWSDSGLTYEYPTTNLGGLGEFLDGTKPCALIYNEVLNPDLNYLKSSGYNITGNITFTDTPYNNGADQNPVYIVFLEFNHIGSNPNYEIELYLDYFKVTAPPINLTITTVLNDYGGVNAPILIGWVTLREDIYLFTTSNQQDPEDPNYVIGDGQIWKFTYDKAGDYSNPSTYNISLIYNNPQLDFTTWRPIANPGMIESRYENPNVQKIYWTDNYNVPRQINVANPNVASLTIDQLNLQPILTMDIPLVTEVIDTGDLLIGVYQVFYRLKTTNGAETRFGPGSQLIPIIDAPESTASLRNYYPSGLIEAPAAKSIIVEVFNLDTDYDTIEFVLVYYNNDNTPKTINIVKEEFIPDNGYVKTVITGGGTPVSITLGELTAFTTAIKRCKTLAAKKQTLFLGNILTGSSTVNWDARAYRFPRNNSQTRIKDALENSYLLDYNSGTYTLSGEINISGNLTTYPNPILVGDTHDCIQNYDMQAPDDDTKYLYKPNSSVLGGAGPNVSYEFITGNVELDADNTRGLGVSSPFTYPVSQNGSGEAGPFIDYIGAGSGTKLSPGTEPQFPYHGNSMGNNQSPFTYDMLVGYRRDEMYRFGIVFFDELDNPTYVNWIADIRMPHIYMPATSQGSSTIGNSAPYIPGAGNTRTRIGMVHSRYTNSDFLPANGVQFTSDIITYGTNNGANLVVSKPLGIRFTIDFSTVPAQYKRAAIVRVPKKDGDRNILGQGIARPTYKPTGTNAGTQVFTCSPYVNNLYDVNTPSTNRFNQVWSDCWTINSPEFLFDTFPGFAGGDQVDFVSLLADLNYSFLRAGDEENPASLWSLFHKDIPNNNFLFGIKTKLYDVIENSTQPAFIKNASSSNSYNLTTAFSLPHASGHSGALSRPYQVGSTVGSSPRTIFHASPRDTTSSGGGVVTGFGNFSYAGYSYGGKSVFFQIDNNGQYNWLYPSYGGQGFFHIDQWGQNLQSLPNYIRQYLVNYKRIPAAQFGGNTYFQRAANEYIPCNNLINISNKSNPITFNLFGGDTRITVTGNTTQFFDYSEANAITGQENLTYQMHYYCIETSIAVDFRRSANNSRTISETSSVPDRFNMMQLLSDGSAAMANLSYWTNPRISNYEHFEIDKVFNHTDKSVYTYFPAPALSTPPNKFDCRIWKSEPKQDGELSESWSIFKPGAYKDVESAYGPINNLIIFRDKMYYFQDKGFGTVQVDEQKVLESADPTASDLVLGSSGILERYDYISTKTGTKHQFSMSVSDYSIIWFDALARKMYRYKPDGLIPVSDIKGLNAFLYNKLYGVLQTSDNPYRFRGIHSTYDFRHNEFYMTFLDFSQDVPLQTTLVYNDLLDGYIGEYTHYPKVYINDKLNIFSPNPNVVLGVDNEELFIHNYGNYATFYDQTPDFSALSFILNSNPTVEKVLNNIEFGVEVFKSNRLGTYELQYDPVAQVDIYDFFDDMRVYDNYQNTDWFTLISNTLDYSGRTNYARKHKTIWNTRLPSDRVINPNTSIFDPANLSSIKPSMTRRLKDKWFMVELRYANNTFTNGLNNKLVVHSAKASYAINSR